MKILITETIAGDGVEILKKEFDVHVKTALDADALNAIIHEYDALIVRSVTKVDERLLSNAVNLKVAARAGSGVDNIDVQAATRKGVIVVNAPEGNSMAAAELTIGLVYSVFRNIPQAYNHTRNNDFRRKNIKGFELNGKVAGIVGLGRIGSIVADRLRNAEMEVVAYDPYVNADQFMNLSVRKCKTLDELLEVSDLITIHLVQTPQTINMFDAPQFAKMKKGVRIVNASRGGVINEKALYDALVDGTVSGAALDVLRTEPNFELPPEKQDYANPLLGLENVIYVPHLGASTQEAQYNVGVQIATSVASALKGVLVPAVNMPYIPAAQMEELKPFIDLSVKLGGIFYQVQTGELRKIDVKCSGDLLEKDTRVITLAALKGLMSPILENDVNYVNAESLAAARGIAVSETKDADLMKYTNLITLTFTTDDRVESISGTVFAKEEIRIVDFFGYKLNFEPTPNVIAIQNVDRPGIIGKIGTTLGDAGFNIAAMQWSRNHRGEKAVAFISVDGAVSDEALQELRNIDGVIKASRIKFD